MIKSITIKNFRCFSSIKLDDLRFVNVVVGSNGSGKTAFLEALVLGLRANPSAAQMLNQSRGLPVPGVAAPGVTIFFGTAPLLFRASWDHFFFQNDLKKDISLEFDEHLSNVRTTYKLRISQGKGSTPFPSDPNSPQFIPAVPPIVFDRSTNRAASVKIFVATDSNNKTVFAGPVANFFDKLVYFDQSSRFNESESVAWLSQLKIDSPDRVKDIEGILARGFPGFSNLDILSPAGNQALWANLLDGVKRPLSLISAGLHKIITLLIAASWIRDGVFIVDEVENGIFYEKYELLWSSLISICKKNNNQIFVSSHSLECMRAMLPLAKATPDDFCVLRSTRWDDHVGFDQFSGELVADSLAGAVEVRGTAEHG